MRLHKRLRVTSHPLELVNIDLNGKLPQQSLVGTYSAIVFVVDRTAKTYIYFMERKSDLFNGLKHYMEWSENITGFKSVNIILNGAEEILSAYVNDFLRITQKLLEKIQSRAPQSNGIAEISRKK